MLRTQPFGKPGALQPLERDDHGEPSSWATVIIRILSFTAEVSSNSSRIVREMASLYPVAEMAPSPSVASPANALAVVKRWREGGDPWYLLRQAGRDLAAFSSASDALLYLNRLVNTAAAVSLRDHLLLHAGAVAHQGVGILLPGASGAGKSTLVAALCLHGFSYLSDELGVMEVERTLLRPFLKAICLKEGGWSTLAAAFGEPAALALAAVAGDQRVRYLAPGRCSPSSRVPVRYILVPCRRPGPTCLTPCSRAGTLAHLAQHSLHLPHHGLAGVECLARLVEGAECYTLAYQDLRDAVEKVSSLVGHPCSRQK